MTDINVADVASRCSSRMTLAGALPPVSNRNDTWPPMRGYGIRHGSVPSGRSTGAMPPAAASTRQSYDLDGMTVEIVSAAAREPIEIRRVGPRHVLAVRDEGERSTALTFVPAGGADPQPLELRTKGRVILFHIDAARLPARSAAGEPAAPLRFDDPGLR
ncbi:MAG: hypothetical protein WC670_00665, partial [Pseudolabrys sp.]